MFLSGSSKSLSESTYFQGAESPLQQWVARASRLMSKLQRTDRIPTSPRTPEHRPEWQRHACGKQAQGKATGEQDRLSSLCRQGSGEAGGNSLCRSILSVNIVNSSVPK